MTSQAHLLGLNQARAELSWPPRTAEQAVRQCLGYLAGYHDSSAS